MDIGETLKVLLVDDDPALLWAFSKDLHDRGGFEVLTAVSSQEALSKIITQRPDLVVLDVFLHDGVDGVECLRRMRATGYKGLVFVLTGESSPDVLEPMVRAGADDYLIKGSLDSIARDIIGLLGRHLDSILTGRPLDRVSEGGFFRSRMVTRDEAAFLKRYAELGCPREKDLSFLLGMHPTMVYKLMWSIREKLGINSTPKLVRIMTLIELMGRIRPDPPEQGV